MTREENRIIKELMHKECKTEDCAISSKSDLSDKPMIGICKYSNDHQYYNAFNFNDLSRLLNILAKRNICNTYNKYYYVKLYYAIWQDGEVKVIYVNSDITCRGYEIVNRILESSPHLNEANAIKIKISDLSKEGENPKSYYILKRKVS